MSRDLPVLCAKPNMCASANAEVYTSMAYKHRAATPKGYYIKECVIYMQCRKDRGII